MENKDIDFYENDIKKYTHSRFPNHMIYYTSGQYIIDPVKNEMMKKRINLLSLSNPKIKKERYSEESSNKITEPSKKELLDYSKMTPVHHFPNIKFEKMGIKKLDWFSCNRETSNLIYNINDNQFKLPQVIKFRKMQKHNLDQYLQKPCFHSEMDIKEGSDKGIELISNKIKSCNFYKMISRHELKKNYCKEGTKQYQPSRLAKLAILELKDQIEKKHKIQLA